MKLNAFFLSLLMISLSFGPCSDIMSPTKEDCVTSCNNSSSNIPSENTEDNCAILCTCNCCGITLTLSEPHYLESKDILAFYKLKQFTYHSKNYPEFQHAIWHPPQLINWPL